MEITITRADEETIKPLRILFLHEGNFQFVCNSYHARNWADNYLLLVDGLMAGYGSLYGETDRNKRDTIFEFYVIPPFRNIAEIFFDKLLPVSKASFIACQSNDALITAMLYRFAKNINAEAILFKDNAVTALACPGVIFRAKKTGENIFEHKGEPEGDYVLEQEGEVVATGGFLLHYNIPYADLYMEVREDSRRKGYGSFLIQELKKTCYLEGRVPAARCGLNNPASKATLLRAGFAVCGHRLEGEVKG